MIVENFKMRIKNGINEYLDLSRKLYNMNIDKLKEILINVIESAKISKISNMKMYKDYKYVFKIKESFWN